MTTGDEPMLQQPQPFQPNGDEPRLGGDRREMLTIAMFDKGADYVVTILARLLSQEHKMRFIDWLGEGDPILVAHSGYDWVIIPSKWLYLSYVTRDTDWESGESIVEFKFSATWGRKDVKTPVERQHYLSEVCAGYEVGLDQQPYPLDVRRVFE